MQREVAELRTRNESVVVLLKNEERRNKCLQDKLFQYEANLVTGNVNTTVADDIGESGSDNPVLRFTSDVSFSRFFLLFLK